MSRKPNPLGAAIILATVLVPIYGVILWVIVR